MSTIFKIKVKKKNNEILWIELRLDYFPFHVDHYTKGECGDYMLWSRQIVKFSAYKCALSVKVYTSSRWRKMEHVSIHNIRNGSTVSAMAHIMKHSVDSWRYSEISIIYAWKETTWIVAWRRILVGALDARRGWERSDWGHKVMSELRLTARLIVLRMECRTAGTVAE